MRTIAAIATPLLNCAIHIIRVSGPDTFTIVQKIAKNKINKVANSIQHNYIIDKKHNIIDEVLLNVFVKPKSYTGEDSIEINCHGGVIIAKKILDLLIINGCEYANNGEFSMQAFLNKKINYQQIEGINNLIHASNELATKFAINSILGNDSSKITKLRDEIFQIMGSIEVNIDYPEYDDVPQYSHDQIYKMIDEIDLKINKVINNSNMIKPVFDGYIIAIVGKPNVGKSSLLNKLTKQEKAIVHNIEGTTRDIVESNLTFNNIPIKLLDTAGIRISNDEIEKIGINKSFDAIKQANLVIWLIDANDNQYLNNNIHNYLIDNHINFIKVFNKSDLKRIEKEINISCINNDLNELTDYLKQYFSSINDFNNHDNLILQSDRQIILMQKISQIINEIKIDLKNNVPLDLIQSRFDECINLFNDILGISFNYDKLDELFSKFCIGK